MDKYLESLVKKSDLTTDVDVADGIIDEAEVEVTVDEAESVETAEEMTEDQVIEEDSVESETNSAESEQHAENIQIGTSIEFNNEPVMVTNVRVYNTPDPNSLSKIISGNIIYKGQSGEMIEIEYMKSGFGLVRGFIKA